MTRSLLVLLGVWLLGGASFAAAQDASRKVFPYPYEVRDLDNGLRVVVVPTDFPNIVSLQIAVAVGSRNEVEPGKSGFAHFFEHMMFRGTKTYPSERYLQVMKNAGASQNAYTSDDLTNYHVTFSKEDLETVLMVEADRFQHLDYSVEDFKTEARAVLGEYNKNASDPVRRLIERQRAVAFREHTYRHTTMGFIEDIEAMPDQYEYSRIFFDRYYRPEKTTLVVAGDVEADQVFDLVERYWGGWERGSFVEDIPEEPPPAGPVYEHVAWETPTLPWVMVAFHGPAFSDTRPDMATMDLVSRVAFSSSSPLYEQLVLREQKVQELGTYFPDHKDPYLVTVYAQVKDPADVWYVRDQIQRAFADLRVHPVAAGRLDDIKRNLRYSFANSLDNSESIAEALPSFLALTRDVESINRLYDLYDRVTPETLRDAARRYFTDARMVVVTLAHETLPTVERATGPVDALAAGDLPAAPAAGDAPRIERVETTVVRDETADPQAAAAPPAEAEIDAVLLPNSAPLVNFRFLFNVGAASDPEGKEGLAELTARMVADAGSQARTYDEIQQALYPMAAGFGAQVDKEMTVFVGRTHRDNLAAYYEIVSDQLLRPGFRQDDFERLRSALVNDIRVGLRGNNDEELGKEVLYEAVYGPRHPYGHLTLGHVAAVEGLTLEDVRRFYRDHYTRANLVLGLAGGFDDAFVARVRRDLAGLPEGTPSAVPLPAPAMPEGLDVTIVDKNTRGTALSIGFPITVTRAHEDFAALWLVRSYFGEHRSSNSYLYARMRQLRGMNYGDYAYIEYFPHGMFQFEPDPNLARRQQIFQLWIRPVVPENAHFALRVALYELEKLVEEGMTREAFEATRAFLLKNVHVLTKSQDGLLGYALDSRYYGIGPFTEHVSRALRSLTLEDVNRALRTHLQRDNLHVVFIAPDAQALKDRLVSDAPSPITYDAPKPPDVVAEDQVIQAYPLSLRPSDVKIIPVDQVFENGTGM